MGQPLGYDKINRWGSKEKPPEEAFLGADGQGRSFGFVLTGGEVSDYKPPALLNLPLTRPKMMLADKGYDRDDVRSSRLMQHLAGHPPRANRKEPIGCDFKVYKDCNRVERCSTG